MCQFPKGTVATQILTGDVKGKGTILARIWIMRGSPRRLTVVSIWIHFPTLLVAVHEMTIILQKEQERSVHQLPLALLRASFPFKVRRPLIWLLRKLTHHVQRRLTPLFLSILFTSLQGT
ncbi:hypothetical protein ACB094_10G020600 [Castanea mollissima]